jgi:hypothetical protein
MMYAFMESSMYYNIPNDFISIMLYCHSQRTYVKEAIGKGLIVLYQKGLD